MHNVNLRGSQRSFMRSDVVHQLPLLVYDAFRLNRSNIANAGVQICTPLPLFRVPARAPSALYKKNRIILAKRFVVPLVFVVQYFRSAYQSRSLLLV